LGSPPPSSKGQLAFTLGIVSIFFNLLYVPGILAIVWGGRERQENSNARRGFVCGIIGTAISALLTLIFVVAAVAGGSSAKTTVRQTAVRPTSTALSAADQAIADKAAADKAAADKVIADKAAAVQAAADKAAADKVIADKAAVTQAAAAAQAAAAPRTLSGTGSKVTAHFTLLAGGYKVAWVARGTMDNFIVHIHDLKGAEDHLVNEIPPNPSSGEVFFDSPGGEFYLDVQGATLTWTITLTPA
jgi:hypothetical protein